MGKYIGMIFTKAYMAIALLSTSRMRLTTVFAVLLVSLSSCEHGHLSRSLADKVRDGEYLECFECKKQVWEARALKRKIQDEMDKEAYDAYMKELDGRIKEEKEKKKAKK